MKAITRRDFLGIAGAGIFAGAVPYQLKAQEHLLQDAKSAGNKNNKALPPDLMSLSQKVVDTNEDFAEDYFWINDHTVLFLRLTPKAKGIFRAVLVDTTTGQKTLPQPFNTKNSSFLLGQSFGFGVDGSKHWDYDYAPPRVTLSPDGQWLLWPTTFGNPDFLWIAAAFDGRQQLWNQTADQKGAIQYVGNDGYWLRDSTGWVELVRKYANKKYTLTHANVFHLGAVEAVKTVRVDGWQDGLDVGMTHDGRVMMFHPPANQANITQAVFSLVSLDKEEVQAERLAVSIPTSYVWQVTLSPQGDRLAWVLEERRDGAQLHVIYVSDLDGKELRPIGAAPGVQIRNNRYSMPSKVRWLPDSSRLSFIYNKAVRVVTA